MRTKFFSFFSSLLLAIVLPLAFSSCSEDGVDSSVYVGLMDSHIEMGEQEIFSGSFRASVGIEDSGNGTSVLTLSPFDVTVAAYNNMNIKSGENLVVSNLRVKKTDEGVKYEGTFSTMMPTSMNGRPATEMLLEGNVVATRYNSKTANDKGKQLDIMVVITRFGNMPHKLVFEGLSPLYMEE